MKTSNKLLLSAFIIFVISLGIYNTALKAEYLTGSYKDPFKNFNTLNFSDFDEIQINAANQADVTITKGAQVVRVSKWAHNQVKITQQGKKLVIDVVYEKDKGNSYGNEVLISCPQLTSLKTFGIYTEGNKKIILNSENEMNMRNRNSHDVVIQGFQQDSLSLQQDNINTVTLKGNKIGSLKSVIGITKGSSAILNIEHTNTIQKADLKVNQKSELQLDNVYIQQLTHQFGDSVKVSFSGAALKSLKN